MVSGATLVIDNLTLQDVGDTLREGLTDDDRVEVGRASDPAGYQEIAVPSPGVQVEALLQLLNTIVLADEMIIEASATETWSDAEPTLGRLRAEQIVVAKPFSDVRSEWLPIRSAVEDALCFSPQLASDFAQFRADWKPGVQHPVFSTLLWSTAGMMARSQFLDVPYLPHPSRGRVIELSSLAPSRSNAQEVVQRFISTERVKLFDRVTSGQRTRATTLCLPALALEVIEESRDLHGLIPTAIQLRTKYRKLREWIGEFQRALDSSPAVAAKLAATLEAAATDIERLFSGPGWAKLTIDIGLSATELPHFSSGLSMPIGATVQRILPGSIRAAVAKLISKPWNDAILDKLFRMLNCSSPKLRNQAIAHLRGS